MKKIALFLIIFIVLTGIYFMKMRSQKNSKQEGVPMNIIESISKYPECKIFRCVNFFDADNPDNEILRLRLLKFENVNDEVLKDGEDYYILKAKYISKSKEIIDCYIDISMNERINDSIFFIEKNEIKHKYSYEIDGDVIPEVAIAGFGSYAKQKYE